jgi:glycosyltransferase involved in cell wall biosynthesis
LLVVGFNGQLDLLVARRLARGRIPVLFVPLVTVTETLVDDRRVYAPGSLGARFAHWLDRTTLGSADLVIADTEAHRAYMCATFGLEPSKTRTLYLGAESFFYTTPPLREGAARSVLFYGQYVALHGASTIVDAARRLNGLVEVVMVGTGPDRPEIEAQARGIPNVRFVDWVPYERLPEWIGEADICLGAFGTSKKAALVVPNKVYQAAAGGRPVVSADTPGVREVFSHGENIWLTPAGDGVRLAEAISTLAADGAQRKAIGCAARALMEGRFGEGPQGDRLRALIEETIGAGGQRKPGKGNAKE